MFLRPRTPQHQRLSELISAAIPSISRPGYAVNAICHITAIYWPAITSAGVTGLNWMNKYIVSPPPLIHFHATSSYLCTKHKKDKAARAEKIPHNLSSWRPNISTNPYNPTSPGVLRKIRKVKTGNRKRKKNKSKLPSTKCRINQPTSTQNVVFKKPASRFVCRDISKNK